MLGQTAEHSLEEKNLSFMGVQSSEVTHSYEAEKEKRRVDVHRVTGRVIFNGIMV